MDKYSPLVSIIIVNYNGRKWLNDCFDSIRKNVYSRYEVILVDNGSHDGSAELIKAKYSWVRLIICHENTGYVGANNIGYKAAKGSIILFLNNDTEVTKIFLSEIIKEFSQNSKVGGIQSKLILDKTTRQLDSVGAFLTNTGFLYHYGIYKQESAKYDKYIDIFSAKGACMAFRKDVLESILVDGQLLDDDYFAYYEETDMCHRVWLAGYKIKFLSLSYIYHKMGATSKQLDNNFIQYNSFKNRISSLIKNLGQFTLVEILPIHLLFCEGFSFIALIKGKWRLAIAINRAIFWNIKNIGKTLHKRKYIQNHIRKISDSDLMPFIKHNPRLEYYIYLQGSLKNYSD